MDLRDYLRAVRKRWWLVLGAVLVGLGTAMLVTALTPPRYAASVTFFVSTQSAGVSDAYQGNLFSAQRVKSYVDALRSDRLAEAVAAESPVSVTADDFQSQVSAKAVPDTVLLQATVTDTSRARALALAQTLATEFPELVKDLETPPGAKAPTVHVEVLAGPKVGDAPVSPQPVRNAGLAVVLGLVAGIGAAALRESLDTTVQSPDALQEATEAPVLCAVPLDGRARKAPLIIEGSAHSSRAEALRQMRTNLQFVNVDSPPRTLVVTSAMASEGKSTTACNLAIVFAEAGKRVVLIDADLRKPRVATYLGLEGAVGLTNVLAGQAYLDDVLQQWGGSGITVLPAGSVPPNPSELLGSGHMAELVRALRGGFDVVIIDTPPLLPVTDAAVVASRVDATVLVARFGKTSAGQARDAAAALRKVGATLVGTVLNMAPGRAAKAYTYYEYADRTPARHSAGSEQVPPPQPMPVSAPPAMAPPPRASTPVSASMPVAPPAGGSVPPAGPVPPTYRIPPAGQASLGDQPTIVQQAVSPVLSPIPYPPANHGPAVWVRPGR